MQSKTPLLMITALVCGLGAAYGTWKLVSGAQAAPASEETKIKVLVPVADIQPYALFSDEKKFTTIEWPKHKLRESPEDTITAFDQLKGKQARHYKLRPNEPVYKNDVCDNADSDISQRLKAGEVAHAIRTDPSTSGGGFVQPGDHVAIMATVKAQGEPEEVRYVLNDIEVLAVDNLAIKDPNGNVLPTNRMVFRVTIQESLVLKAYGDGGQLTIVKRRVDDKTNYLDVSFQKGRKTIVAKQEDEQPAATPVQPDVKTVAIEEPKTDSVKSEPKSETPKGPEYDEKNHTMHLNDGTNDKTREFPNVKYKTVKTPETAKDAEKDKGPNGATKENGEKKAEGKKNEPGQ